MSNRSERFLPQFTNTVITVRFYQIGYSFTFLLGFLGNISSLLTFSRPTLRKVSTGCLFMALAISDMLFLLTCIIDFLEFGLDIKFFPTIAYNEFCRFRTFVMSTAQLASAWILVIIALDRWIRTPFPFKSAAICTPRNAFIAIFVLLIVDIGLHAHILTPLFGMLIPNFANGACGPYLFIVNTYLIFYYRQWSVIQIFTICLIPVFFMLVASIDIRVNIYLRKRTLVQPTAANANTRHVQNQMFILMFASICIFFLTTLPINLYKIISSQTDYISAIAVQASTILTILGWIQSLNQAINFYIHCLTSTLFRREFYERITTICQKDRTQIEISTFSAPQTTGHRLKLNHHITVVPKKKETIV